ncbi:MAG: response regulator [Chloroflexi bacterium]|nr:response regulator [Chloroflexota bacterium]
MNYGSQPQPMTASLPEEFVDQVKQALEHLYDFPSLQHHPLALLDDPAGEGPGETAGQRLRKELLMAVETLSPEPGAAFRSPHARLYNLLQLHYVEGRTIQETAHELGISVRQAYRDLRRGEESVAAILWANQPKFTSSPEPRATQLSSVQAEMARLETHPRPVDLRLLLQQAHKAVERLAQQQALTFQFDLPAQPIVISTDPLLAQQVLINLLSHTVQQAKPGLLPLTLQADPVDTLLTLHYSPKTAAGSAAPTNEVLEQLTKRLGWTLRVSVQPDDSRVVSLQVARHGPVVLVIDDNAGLVELLDRYLTGHACQVLAATSGQAGLQLTQQTLPDAIILDVMMPDMDGWELLQRLRTSTQTAATPVIICSVFNDPELAYSLGASLFLPKPVNRNDVLTALRQLGIV